MSSYTTIANLKLRENPSVLAGLCDDVNKPPDIDDATATNVANRAIMDASAVIDSYVLGKLDMSDSTNQSAAEYRCAMITLYLLHRRKFKGNDDEVPYYSGYMEALAWCEGIREGRFKTDDDPLSPRETITSTTLGVDKKFNSTALTGLNN